MREQKENEKVEEMSEEEDNAKQNEDNAPTDKESFPAKIIFSQRMEIFSGLPFLLPADDKCPQGLTRNTVSCNSGIKPLLELFLPLLSIFVSIFPLAYMFV